MAVRRLNNGRAAPADRTIAVPEVLELAALEDLGPLTRRAICESALPTLAYSIVAQIIDVNEKIEAENVEREKRGEPLRGYIDPKHPELDRRFAVGVVENNFKLIAGDVALLGDRSVEWATMGIKPLVARPSAKTHRERRKTEGRIFRGW